MRQKWRVLLFIGGMAIITAIVLKLDYDEHNQNICDNTASPGVIHLDNREAILLGRYCALSDDCKNADYFDAHWRSSCVEKR